MSLADVPEDFAGKIFELKIVEGDAHKNIIFDPPIEVEPGDNVMEKLVERLKEMKVTLP